MVLVPSLNDNAESEFEFTLNVVLSPVTSMVGVVILTVDPVVFHVSVDISNISVRASDIFKAPTEALASFILTARFE
jgi:hypothetical protein